MRHIQVEGGGDIDGVAIFILSEGGGGGVFVCACRGEVGDDRKWIALMLKINHLGNSDCHHDRYCIFVQLLNYFLDVEVEGRPQSIPKIKLLSII